MHRFARPVLLACVLGGLMLLTVPPAPGQITVTALRGIVRDPSGAVMPNVVLELVDRATGVARTSASGEDGSFLFSNLIEGVYRLTAKAPGFQTAVYDSIVVNAGRTTDLAVDMKIGTPQDVVTVSADAVRLETTTNTVSTTIKNTSIHDLPHSGRDTLNFALLMPGAMSSGTTDRYSTFNGLPNASMNITIDGVNNNSQRFKSGGTSFFAFAPARIDAMEEVTVSTSGLGAEASGQGAMSIQFVTKRGTNRYRFRLLEQWHNDWLNAWPYMTKLASHYDKTQFKPKTRQNYIVAHAGGPLVPWISSLKDRLFFFAYFEAEPRPSGTTYSTTLLQHEALEGNYTFIDKSGVRRTLNVLDVARQNGFPSTVDPLVRGILDEIKATESTPGVSFQEDPNYPFRKTMRWRYDYYTRLYYPTARVDFHITPSLSWTGTWNYRNAIYAGAPPYPGEMAKQYDWAGNNKTNTYVLSNAVNWTISPKMLNNFVFGIQMNGEYFSTGFDIRQWKEYGDRRLSLPLITYMIPNSPSDVRNNPVFEFKDNLTWIKGKHAIKLGGSLLHTYFWSRYYGNYAGVLNYSFGVRSDDPIYNVLRNALTAANASTTTSDISYFLNLYALLTGRISGISGTANVNPETLKFEKFFAQRTNFAFTTAGLFIQDSYRVTPQLTLNYGLRWQLDGSIHGTIPIYSTVAPESFWGPSKGNFQPGILGGDMNPGFIQKSNPYKADLVNAAPNFGFAWNPNFENGILRLLFGGSKTVIRSSFGMTYYNEGLNTVSNYLPGNPGATQSITATANVDFAPGQLSLSSPDPSFSVSPQQFAFPIPLADFVLKGGRSVNAFNPNLKSPYTSNWMFGIQRELMPGMVLDVRYVGNKSTHMWHQQNLAEINIVENGFLQEFLNARTNLAINRAAGVQSFENRGLPGQVPLPIFEAAFGANGSQPALSQSSGFRNTSYIQYLDFGQAGTFAGTLASTTQPSLYCRLVGGNFAPCAALGYTTPRFPINFFKANPFANNLNYLDSNGDNNYNGLQVQLNKQMGNGLMFNVSYTWSHMLGTQGNVTGQGAEDTWVTLRNARLSYGEPAFDHRHSFSSYWEYELPFGPGRWFSPSNRILSRVLGNWKIGGIDRIIAGGTGWLTGGRATFNTWADGGVVFGKGLTARELIRRLDTIVGDYDYSCRCFRTNVADIQLPNGAVNPDYYRPGDTPGVIGYDVKYRGKTTFQLDLSVSKEILISERVRMGLKANISNFLNHPFRTGYGSTTATGTSFGQVSSFSGTRTMNIRAYIDF